VLAGLLFGEPESWPTVLLMIGVFVCLASFIALSLHLTPEGIKIPAPRPQPAFEPSMAVAIEPAGAE